MNPSDSDNLPQSNQRSLFERIVYIIDNARERIVSTINQELVRAYWLISREIVNELQGGEQRADYGKVVLKQLSVELSKQYGKGYSVSNLDLFRKFYLAYRQEFEEPDTAPSELPALKSDTLCRKLNKKAIRSVLSISSRIPTSWSFLVFRNLTACTKTH